MHLGVIAAQSDILGVCDIQDQLCAKIMTETIKNHVSMSEKLIMR